MDLVDLTGLAAGLVATAGEGGASIMGRLAQCGGFIGKCWGAELILGYPILQKFKHLLHDCKTSYWGHSLDLKTILTFAKVHGSSSSLRRNMPIR